MLYRLDRCQYPIYTVVLVTLLIPEKHWAHTGQCWGALSGTVSGVAEGDIADKAIFCGRKCKNRRFRPFGVVEMNSIGPSRSSSPCFVIGPYPGTQPWSRGVALQMYEFFSSVSSFPHLWWYLKVLWIALIFNEWAGLYCKLLKHSYVRFNIVRIHELYSVRWALFGISSTWYYARNMVFFTWYSVTRSISFLRKVYAFPPLPSGSFPLARIR